MEFERALMGSRFRRLLEVVQEAENELPEPLSYWYLGHGRMEIIRDDGDDLSPVATIGSTETDEIGYDQAESRNLKLARFFAAFSPASMRLLMQYMRDCARVWQQFATTEWEYSSQLEDMLRDILSRPEVLTALHGESVLDDANRLLRDHPRMPDLPSFDQRSYVPSEASRDGDVIRADERTAVIGGTRVVITEGTIVPLRRPNGTVGRFSVERIRRNRNGTVVFSVVEADDLFDVACKWVSLKDVLPDW